MSRNIEESAWEIAKKLSKFSNEEREEIFGYNDVSKILETNSPTTAYLKMNKYENEQKKKEVWIGDVVNYHGIDGIVTYVKYDNKQNPQYLLVSVDGDHFTANKNELEKTGKHINISNELEKFIYDKQKTMSFIDILSQLIEPTPENFPTECCTIQDKREKNVLDSDVPFLGLVFDRRFDYYLNLVIVYPYIYKESDGSLLYGWVDKHGQVYGNIHNSCHLYDEFVIGFKEYADDNFTKLKENLIEVIELQYEKRE